MSDTQKKVRVYICENGHAQNVRLDNWMSFKSGTLKPCPPPKQRVCWELWEDGICQRYAKPLDSLPWSTI